MAGRASNYEKTTEEILTPIAEANGCRVYDVEYVKVGKESYLRCYIDKDGGVTIGDCEKTSRALSEALDSMDLIPEAYTLEVSSPGLGRTLTKDRHLTQSIGQAVEGRFYKPEEIEGLQGKIKEFEGVLKSFDRDSIVIETETGCITIPRKAIGSLRLKLVL
ncbi:MAG: ribosome maturation factor RimP [Lachnospiraceae bacterium]